MQSVAKIFQLKSSHAYPEPITTEEKRKKHTNIELKVDNFFLTHTRKRNCSILLRAVKPNIIGGYFVHNFICALIKWHDFIFNKLHSVTACDLQQRLFSIFFSSSFAYIDSFVRFSCTNIDALHEKSDSFSLSFLFLPDFFLLFLTEKQLNLTSSYHCSLIDNIFQSFQWVRSFVWHSLALLIKHRNHNDYYFSSLLFGIIMKRFPGKEFWFLIFISMH